MVNDGLAKIFKDIEFIESAPELDHAYIAKVGNYQIGIQIKPIIANANFPQKKWQAKYC